jgi:four helix bundle protein
MATISRFEDIDAWQLARKQNQWLRSIIVKTELKKDFPLKNQIEKSMGSIMDNIAEGFERNGNREFIQFLSIAKASCGETRSQLYRMLDFGYIDQQEFDTEKENLILISKKISGLITYLKRSESKGYKFNEENEGYGFETKL